MNYELQRKTLISESFCRFNGVLIFFILLFSFQTKGFCRWNKMAQFPATVNSSYFFNEQRGFIGMDGANGIKRTYDGGQTWLGCTIPSGFTGYLTDIFMKDSLNGWAGVENDNVSHGLWFTTDGGITWNANTSLTGQVSSVYQTSSALICSDRFSTNRLLVSTNSGASFIHIGSDRFNNINFVDDFHGVASVFENSTGMLSGTALYTSDGGKVWQPTSALTIEAWGVYAQKGSSNFFVVGEGSQSSGNSWEDVYSSIDYGATWQTISTVYQRTTGHIAGIGSVMYVQCWTKTQFPNNQTGLLRSTDGGRTWINVGGPSNFRDTRFSVSGCQGGIVYAFDETGGVWKTTDGGDGAIQNSAIITTPASGEINLSSSPCNTITQRIEYSNFLCNSVKIESIDFIDSTISPVSSGALSFIRYPKLPETLNSSSGDSIILQWDPKKLNGQKNISKAFIKIHGSIPSSATVFDSLLAINLQILPLQPEQPDSIRFSITKLGDQICTTFVFKNSAPIGSPAFVLESAGLNFHDEAFHISPLLFSFPAIVVPQDSVTLDVCFTVLDTLSHHDSLVIKTDCFSFGTSLNGHGSTGLILAGDLDFGTVHLGDTVCKGIFIKNVGLSPFTLTKSFVLSDDTNFSIGTNTFPIIIKAGGSAQVQVCFRPSSEGTFFGRINWGTDLDPLFEKSIKNYSLLHGRTLNSGVSSFESTKEFILLPNPTQNDIDIRLQKEIGGSEVIEIFDALGKNVFLDKRELESGMNNIHLDTRNLSTGIYLLRIGNLTQHFVKE